MNKKLEALQEYLKELGSVAIAFSSGVDSTFLLKVAHDVLGDQVIAVTAQSCSFPKRELEEAKAFCKKKASNILSASQKNYRSKDFPIIQRTAVIFANMNCLKKSEILQRKTISNMLQKVPIWMTTAIIARDCRQWQNFM